MLKSARDPISLIKAKPTHKFLSLLGHGPRYTGESPVPPDRSGIALATRGNPPYPLRRGRRGRSLAPALCYALRGLRSELWLPPALASLGWARPRFGAGLPPLPPLRSCVLRASAAWAPARSPLAGSGARSRQFLLSAFAPAPLRYAAAAPALGAAALSAHPCPPSPRPADPRGSRYAPFGRAVAAAPRSSFFRSWSSWAAARFNLFPPLSRPMQNRGLRLSAWSGRSCCSSLARRCPCRAPAGGTVPPAPCGTPFRARRGLRLASCPSPALATLGTSVVATLRFFSASTLSRVHGVHAFPLGAVARGLPYSRHDRVPAG